MPDSDTVEFRVGNDFVHIVLSGHVDREAVLRMRTETMRTIEHTGIVNFVVDMRAVRSVADGNLFQVYDLGTDFRSVNFPYRSQTIVLLPLDAEAREQAVFLHTVEVNRGRPSLRYADTLEAALAQLATPSRGTISPAKTGP